MLYFSIYIVIIKWRSIRRNKTELVKAVSTQAELTQKDAAKAVDASLKRFLTHLLKKKKSN